MNRVLRIALKKTPKYVLNSLRVSKPFMLITPKRFYWPNDKLMKREEGVYFNDPKEVAETVCKLFALHDNVKDPSQITLNSSFEDLGLNDLDKAEILLMLESHYGVEISDESWESFVTLNDVAEYIARDFYV